MREQPVRELLQKVGKALEGSEDYPELNCMVDALIERKNQLTNELSKASLLLTVLYTKQTFKRYLEAAKEYRQVVEALESVASGIVTVQLSDLFGAGFSAEPEETEEEEEPDKVTLDGLE